MASYPDVTRTTSSMVVTPVRTLSHLRGRSPLHYESPYLIVDD
ncbi:MAG: hypothetical protein ACE5O2_02545 [Armatimonadota bacterium]